MSEPLQPEQLRAIAERAEAATPGPWINDRGRPMHYGELEDKNGPSVHAYKTLPFKNSDADWNFIAHAREDVPALLATIAALGPFSDGELNAALECFRLRQELSAKDAALAAARDEIRLACIHSNPAIMGKHLLAASDILEAAALNAPSEAR